MHPFVRATTLRSVSDVDAAVHARASNARVTQVDNGPDNPAPVAEV